MRKPSATIWSATRPNSDTARRTRGPTCRSVPPTAPPSPRLAPSSTPRSPGAATGRSGGRWRSRVIYELHVKGFTQRHPDIPPALRGTFAGSEHPAAIDYLTRLGVTAVELLPV